MTTTTPDFQFIDHGSIWLLFPRTTAANDLLRSDAFGGAQVLGEAIVVEPRYVDTLADQLTGEGFLVGLV